MTLHLLQLGPQGALASDRPIIKAAEHESLADVFALLARLRTVEAAQAEAAREALAEARARGHAEGFADGRAAFAKAIAEMAAEAKLHRQAEEEEIAALAMAAVRQMMGTIGEQHRMDGTVISDAVNLAARLESLTKDYRVPLLVSQFAVDRLDDARAYALRPVDTVVVRGRTQPVAIFEVQARRPSVRQPPVDLA